MRLLILHLSDIHFKETDNAILKQIDRIRDAIRQPAIDTTHCICVVSGDIAFSGKAAEYNIALDFFVELKEAMAKIGDSLETQFVIIPGNHDCNLDRHTIAREMLISKATEEIDNLKDASVLQEITVVQQDFFDWLGLMADNRQFSGTERLCYEYVFDLGDDHRVKFICYNTAWMDSPPEVDQKQVDQKRINFPLELIKETTGSADIRHCLVFSVLHHPYNWLSTEGSRDFKKHVERTSNIIIAGHEHDSAYYQRKGTDEANQYLDGGILQNTDDTISSFNVLLIDLDERRWRFWEYNWTGNMYEAKEPDPQWDDVPKHRLLGRDEFTIDGDFYKTFLTDPGANYKHPRRRGTLTLADIYIYPDLEELSGEKNRVIIRGPDIPEYAFENKKVMLRGPELSGKTALLKMLYMEMWGRGIVPLLLDARDIKSPTEDKMARLISDVFIKQYSACTLERYKQLPKEDKVLFIDDFEKVQLNRKGKNELLSFLMKHYDRVIIATYEFFELEELTIQDGAHHLLGFVHCEVKEFGHLQREKMIEKWLFLEQEYTASEQDIGFKTNQLRNTIDTILGTNLLPSYPFFIIIILQCSDRTTINLPLNKDTGSFGYYYDVLITYALSTSDPAIKDLDTKYNYLSDLAYYMFQANVTKLPESELLRFHNNYCTDYMLKTSALSYKHMIQDLATAHMLLFDGGYCHFRYRYIFYYFVARSMNIRLQDPVQESQIRQQITQLNQTIHEEDSAHILIFFSYMSQDPFIREEMLKNARQIFRENPLFDLNKDVAFINTVDAKPKFVLPDKEPKKAREEQMRLQDDIEETLQGEDNETSEVEDDDVLTNLHSALKAIQVMGQVLRNFAGSLKGAEKYPLASECYLLGLRTLKEVTGVIESDLGEFKKFIETNVVARHDARQERFANGRKRQMTEAEIQTQVNRYAFMFVGVIVYAIVKLISRSAGSEKLELTYDDVREKNQSLAIDMIDLAIKLDHFKHMPQNEVFDLADAVQTNPVALMVLQQMVWERLYLYSCEYSIKQRLCAKLEISMGDSRLIDSRQRKAK